MDHFGKSSPENMPTYFFGECLELDPSSALRADVSQQNYSVCPRHWYVDATLTCSRCSETFQFFAAEQKRWYEELGFHVESYAKNCPACRKIERTQKLLRKQYDRNIKRVLQQSDLDAKRRMAADIDELCLSTHDVPLKIRENREMLERQITRMTAEDA